MLQPLVRHRWVRRGPDLRALCGDGRNGQAEPKHQKHGLNSHDVRRKQFLVQRKSLNPKGSRAALLAKAHQWWDTDNSAVLRALRRERAKMALVDPERADLRFKRGTRNAESGRCSSGPEYAPAAYAQRILDDRLLLRGERARQPDRGSESRAFRGQPALVDREFVGVRDDDGPLDDVLQLAHIAGTRIGLQSVERPLADPSECLSDPPRVATDEVLHQYRNVFSAFPQRRHLEGKHVEPIEQILSKRAVRHRRGQITIRCGDDANIDLDPLSPPHALEFALLEDPQQCHLCVGRKFAHLVQEDRAAVRQLEPTESPLHGPGEGAFFMTEELRGNQVAWNGHTV